MQGMKMADLGRDLRTTYPNSRWAADGVNRYAARLKDRLTDAQSWADSTPPCAWTSLGVWAKGLPILTAHRGVFGSSFDNLFSVGKVSVTLTKEVWHAQRLRKIE